MTPTRWWAVIALVPLIAVALWFTVAPEQRAAVTTAIGLTPSPPKPARAKPICSQVIVPAGDCIPQYLAHLPPDPGPEGMKTLEGIDADKDGVRDDVQRFIFIEYGHSQRAVAALTALAKNSLMYVKAGDSISGDEAYALVKDNHAATCYGRSVGEEILASGALEAVSDQVTNTPERADRFWKFQQRVAHQGQGFMLPDFEEPLEKLCGYDPAKLPN